jgi:hypothetical protein
VSGAVSLIVTSVPAGMRTSSPLVESTTAVPAPPPIAAPLAAPSPPPRIPPIRAPAPAPTPIFVASFCFVPRDMREYVAVLIGSRDWPGSSMVLKRNPIDARPFTLPAGFASVTCPDTAVPIGSACKPSMRTARRRVPCTGSSMRLVSDPTIDVNATVSVVPAGSVSSRYSGLRSVVPPAGARRSSIAGFASAPVAPLSFDTRAEAGAAGASATGADGFALVSAVTAGVDRIEAISARGTLVFTPSRLSTMTLSASTSTSRPATVTPSVFSSVTSLPVGMSSAFLRSQAPSAAVRLSAISSFLMYSPGRSSAMGVPGALARE